MKLYQRLLLTALATETAFTATVHAELATADHFAHYERVLNDIGDSPAVIAQIQRHDDRRSAMETQVAQTLRAQAIDTLPASNADFQTAIEHIASVILNSPEGHIVADALHKSDPNVDVSNTEVAASSKVGPVTILETINDFISSAVREVLRTATSKGVLLQQMSTQDLSKAISEVAAPRKEDINKIRPQVPSNEVPPPPTISNGESNTINNDNGSETPSGDASGTQPSGSSQNNDNIGTTPSPTNGGSGASSGSGSSGTNTDPAPIDPSTVTSLTYSGQDLTQYTSLTHIIIPVSQLNTPITSTKKLHTTITGDASGSNLNFANLNFDISTLDLSSVINIQNNHVDITTHPNSIDLLDIMGGDHQSAYNFRYAARSKSISRPNTVNHAKGVDSHQFKQPLLGNRPECNDSRCYA